MATNTLEYRTEDPKIAHPLGRLRGLIRRYVTVEGALAVLLFLAMWFWLAVLIDFGTFKVFAFDWALDANKAFRVIALGGAVALLLAIVVTKVILRLSRDFSQSSLALVLEKRYPKILGDRLITAVQLADLDKARAYGFSTDMIRKTIDDVRGKIDRIPVSEVFNWRRLWLQAGAVLLLTLGFFVLSGVAVCAVTKSSPQTFLHDFRDVSAILAERDLLLMNTPWPRRAYLEVVDFAGDEIRIGRDVPSPRVRVAAYKWVVADSQAPVGWRPLTWADVPAVLGRSAPDLPLAPVRDARFAVEFGPLVYGSAHPFQAPTLPADVANVPADPAKWPVDRVEQVFVENVEVRAMLGSIPALAEVEATLAALETTAADPAKSRTVRKLAVPDEVALYYKGPRTSVDMKMRAEPNNEYTATLSDLKESVKFFARGENFDTPRKLITLVPPPMLTELKRDEFHPAYLYHKAPFAEARGLPDEQKPYLADPAKLKGVRHVLREQSVSLTGDKSRFDIPYGADFVLYGTADKPLKEAKLLPKAGKFPGIEADATDPAAIDLAVADEHSFRFEFDAAHKTQVIRQTEFDIFLRDTDGVTSRRAVQIVVDEDRPPEVDVVVDVIRKVNGVYMCTPQALIPFTKESKVRDDKGLNRVEYVYTYAEIEPLAVTLKRIEYAAWLFNSVPVLPSLVDPVYRMAVSIENLPRVRPTLATVDKISPVPVTAFLDEYRKRQRTLDQIKSALVGPKPQGADLDVINVIDYANSGVEVEDGFDLRKVAPGLKRGSENEVQRNYLLTLTVVAVDTNVEAAAPGTSQNKEALIFRLVGEGELLTEISREEAALADKLDDAIHRLADVDNKLRSMTARLPGLKNPEDFVADQTRANELAEQLGKAKDVTGEVGTDYARILLEFQTNRLPDHLISQIKDKVVDKLKAVLATDFPQTEEAYGAFHATLQQARVPNAETTSAAQQKLTILLVKLREIRAGIGQGLDIKKAISMLEELIRNQVLVQKSIDDMGERFRIRLVELSVFPPQAAVTIAGGQKATVRVPIQIGDAYNGNYTLKLEPSPNSDLKALPTIKVKDYDTEFVLEITAGFTKGNHYVRVSPDQGVARDVRVIVK